MPTLSKTDIVYYLAASIDGYIAKSNGDVDWLAPYFIPELGFHDFIEEIGTVAMGRATFEKILSFGQWPYSGKPGLIVTHRPLPGFDADLAQASGSSADIASALAAAGPGPYWLVGGAQLAGQLLADRMITRIDHFIIPEIIGEGIPALFLQRHMPMDLIGTQTFSNGVVCLSYKPRASIT